MPPSQEALPAQYQPSAYSNDITILRRLRFRPDPAIYGPGPYPVAITAHAGGFRDVDAYGSTSQRWADKDLAKAGFLVFSIDHRLAPDGLILNQHMHDNTTPEGIASGRPPQQSNDVKQQILAAKYDSQCNGVVFFVGGSSGGTHGLWAALDPAPTVPGWSAAEFPKAVVTLSAPCDLSSRVGDIPADVAHFALDVGNYTNTTDPGGFPYQYSVSPIALVAAAMNIPPIRLFTTFSDSVPRQQSDEMKAALLARGVEVVEVTIQGSSLHAFNYWHTKESATGPYVSDDVIAFLKSHLP